MMLNVILYVTIGHYLINFLYLGGSVKISVSFQHHCFSNSHDEFHADPSPDIFLSILFRDIVVGLVLKWYGLVICRSLLALP